MQVLDRLTKIGFHKCPAVFVCVGCRDNGVRNFQRLTHPQRKNWTIDVARVAMAGKLCNQFSALCSVMKNDFFNDLLQIMNNGVVRMKT